MEQSLVPICDLEACRRAQLSRSRIDLARLPVTSYPDCTPLSDDGDDHEHRRDALHAACVSLRRGAYRRRRGAVDSRGGAHHGRVRHICEARGLDGVWRLWLIAGILAAPSFWNASPPVFSTSAPLLVLSGLLVGFGARLG